MNEIANIVILFLLLTLLLGPFFIVVGALFPQRSTKTLGVLNLMPGRAFAVGLVNLVFFAAMGLLFLIVADKTNDLLKTVLTIGALIIFSVLAITLSLGLTSVTQLIGERIAPSQSAWRRTLWGTLLLGVGCAVPLVGWFLLLPYASCVGIGAFITGFFQPERPPLPTE
jgi:hypothetical protein